MLWPDWSQTRSRRSHDTFGALAGSDAACRDPPGGKSDLVTQTSHSKNAWLLPQGCNLLVVTQTREGFARTGLAGVERADEVRR